MNVAKWRSKLFFGYGEYIDSIDLLVEWPHLWQSLEKIARTSLWSSVQSNQSVKHQINDFSQKFLRWHKIDWIFYTKKNQIKWHTHFDVVTGNAYLDHPFVGTFWHKRHMPVSIRNFWNKIKICPKTELKWVNILNNNWHIRMVFHRCGCVHDSLMHQIWKSKKKNSH